jgi:di/tricarboxylate transporter
MQPFGFFEFAPLGLIMVAAGTIYLLVTSRWLLPKRRGEADNIDKYRLADYLAELQVLADSPLIGKSWLQSRVEQETKVELANLIREDKAVSRPDNTKIRPGDLLLLHGHVDRIMAMEQKYRLELLKDVKVKDRELSTHETQLVEGLIPPGSNLIGGTLRNSDFFRRYKSIILALQRRGKILRDRLGDIEMESGDNLLLQAHKDDVVRLMNSANVVVTSELTELLFRRNRAIAALLIIIAVVALAAFNVLPIMIAAIVGAVCMVLTRCITIGEAYNAIDWKIIFLLGGIIPLGLALEQSGAILWLADRVLQPFLACCYTGTYCHSAG